VRLRRRRRRSQRGARRGFGTQEGQSVARPWCVLVRPGRHPLRGLGRGGAEAVRPAFEPHRFTRQPL